MPVLYILKVFPGSRAIVGCDFAAVYADGHDVAGCFHEEAGEDHFVLDEGFIDENKGFHGIIACVMALFYLIISKQWAIKVFIIIN
jgi:hypothetical protein